MRTHSDPGFEICSAAMRGRVSTLSHGILRPQRKAAFLTTRECCKPPARRNFSSSATGDTYQQHQQTPSSQPVESDVQVEASKPRLMSYNEEHYNKVLLTGVACEDPEMRTSKQGRKYVVLTLAQPYPKKEWIQKITLTFWDASVDVVMGDVARGSQIAVSGCLSEWNDRVSLHVEDFYLVAASTSPFTQEMVQYILDRTQQVETSNGTLPVTKSKAHCHNLYTIYNLSAKEVAKQRNIKETTVIGYLAEVAVAGLNVDWTRLCKEAHLGPTQSEFITADEIHEAVTSVVEDIHALGTGVFNNTILSKIRARLQAQSQDKFNIQQDLLPGFVFAQIRVVLAMVLTGLGPKEWNGFIVPPDEQAPPF